MPISAENSRRLERAVLLAGSIEMIVSAAMTGMPDVFPTRLWVLVGAIGLLTFGVALTLYWTDVGQTTRRFLQTWVGPLLLVTGLLIILAFGFWTVYQAPDGLFSQPPSLAVVLVTTIVVLAAILLKNGRVPAAAV